MTHLTESRQRGVGWRNPSLGLREQSDWDGESPGKLCPPSCPALCSPSARNNSVSESAMDVFVWLWLSYWSVSNLFQIFHLI